MAEGLVKVKRRIVAVKSTQKITNAMKLVSSIKAKRWERNFNVELTYFNEYKEIVTSTLFANIANTEAYIESVFLESYENANKAIYIIVTSNLGLCGGYNNNVTRELGNVIKKEDEVILIGEKGLSYLKEKGITYNSDFIGLGKNLDLDEINYLVDLLIEKYKSKKYHSINIIYTKFINSVSFAPRIVKVLPLTRVEQKTYEAGPIYAPNREIVIDFLVNKVLGANLHAYLYESLYSEESARRNAMDNADKNANELIETLNLEYNKARQQAITQEITEVVAGAKSVQ